MQRKPKKEVNFDSIAISLFGNVTVDEMKYLSTPYNQYQKKDPNNNSDTTMGQIQKKWKFSGQQHFPCENFLDRAVKLQNCQICDKIA